MPIWILDLQPLYNMSSGTMCFCHFIVSSIEVGPGPVFITLREIQENLGLSEIKFLRLRRAGKYWLEIFTPLVPSRPFLKAPTSFSITSTKNIVLFGFDLVTKTNQLARTH